MLNKITHSPFDGNPSLKDLLDHIYVVKQCTEALKELTLAQTVLVDTSHGESYIANSLMCIRNSLIREIINHLHEAAESDMLGTETEGNKVIP